MIDIRKFDSLGHADHGWLDARHHFSFANYHDPARMGWGRIRVWNDDRIGAKSGFPPHPHRDMEIVTYVRTGAITHQDSMGNKGRTGAGDVQVMSAGTGVTHAEYNLEDEATTLFQIWIETDQPSAAAELGRQALSEGFARGRVPAARQRQRRDGALGINADARVLGATVKAGDSIAIDADPVAPPLSGAERPGARERSRGRARATASPSPARSGLAIEAEDDSELVLVDAALAARPRFRAPFIHTVLETRAVGGHVPGAARKIRRESRIRAGADEGGHALGGIAMAVAGLSLGAPALAQQAPRRRPRPPPADSDRPARAAEFHPVGHRHSAGRAAAGAQPARRLAGRTRPRSDQPAATDSPNAARAARRAS